MELGKVPPQDIEAEQAVIGSMLTDQEAVSSAIETLKPEDFYREDNKIIYEAILNIYNSLDLNYDLVWSQEHLTTNYNTINFWNSFGAKYTYISSDITEEEIIEISKKSNSKLMVTLFGYLPMFVSKRHIVKNYLEYFDLNDNSKINYMEKEGKTYPIIDNNIGTQVYSNNILNGIKFKLNLDVEYIILNSFNIDLDKFISIIDMFKTVKKDNVVEYNDKINNMFTNIDEGFLNTKTIYRVKKNDK